jgi:histidine ammonia-lyase
MEPLPIDGASLTLENVVSVAREGVPVALTDGARARMAASLAWVDKAVAGEVCGDDGEPLPIYGVNTGYGSLARVRIDPEHAQQLSWNLMRSHAAGVGDDCAEDVVRATMLLRANALAKGVSGCRPALVDSLCAMLGAGVTPAIPSRGSCGSSGDLAPLSHLALVVFRGPDRDDPAESGFAVFDGERLTGTDAMAAAQIARLVPAAKDGLAITNGAQLTTAVAALACADALRLVKLAEISAAMSWEALRGVTRALHPGVHALRPYRGAIATAANLRRLITGSSLVDSLPDKLQDAYSLRCTPQVLGAVRDGIRFACTQVTIELNAATDNPIMLLDADDGPNKAYSAGLFHGEPVGMAADHLKLSLCELGALAERRIYRLTTGSLSARLPPLLVRKDKPGMGLMVPQTTAAALVAENRALAWPASADSIPTCEDQEDHVAMSTTAAWRAAEVLRNAELVIAIELLSAAHGLWWRQREESGIRLGAGTTAALAAVEAAIGGGHATPSEDIAAIAAVIRNGSVLAAVQAAVGPMEGAADA